MLFESLFFLLLPVAALSGWVVGRRGSHGEERDKPQKIDISPVYLKGLNFLLNEQPDKAIDVFIQLLEVDSDTIETHLALGSLFRRRGEVDRAIRIHQNLIARPTLTKEQRAQSLFELGQDYLRAGLLDRAEALFSELLTSIPHTETALNYLIDIYQQEKDWDKAIETARRLEVKTGKGQYARIAHYYCEQAEQAQLNGDKTRAVKLVKRALNANRGSVRASLIEGKLAMQDGNDKAAIKAFRRIEQQDISYLGEAVRPLKECYRRLNRLDEMTVYLKQLLTQQHGVAVALVLSELIQEQQGDMDAVDFITQCLKHRPSVRAMNRLIELNLRQSSETVQEKLQILKDVTQQLLEIRPSYQCHVCGFSSKQLYWQCPSCRNWDSVKHIQGVEGE